ncbi:DNA-processing protein DprA [Cardiobacteriaceae bacterium TAE3-ERU3]|nr:DNA-processing protein DprA [Cardiobacteriaceae bacterium TAE3-ERU3]
MLVEAFGSPEAFFIASTAHKRKTIPGISDKLWAQWESARDTGSADLAWLDEGDDRHIITLHDPAYPPQLRHIPDPPPVLFVRGDPEVLHAPQLAVVGSRQADRSALRNSHDFSAGLASAGLVITSGLALGVDGAAHQGAIDGGGRTIAVVATGLDRVYPARHHKLATDIISHGAVVSEMPIGTEVRNYLFPRRNRIISGLSLGILVIQASMRSGSLITARQALEQGREVFAIPGSIHDPLSHGCHALIKSGAALVESITDIITELRGLNGSISAQAVTGPDYSRETTDLSADAQKILSAMSYEICTVDYLDSALELTNAQISAILLELELDEYVERMPGGRYRRLH